jgi:hypothetical protein
MAVHYDGTKPVWGIKSAEPDACGYQSAVIRGGVDMAVMLIARFDGDVDQLTRAYDGAHALIMSRGGATGVGELRHHCAIGEGALYIIGVWESEEHVRSRWASDEFESLLTSVGFPPPRTANVTILQLHAIEPPL